MVSSETSAAAPATLPCPPTEEREASLRACEGEEWPAWLLTPSRFPLRARVAGLLQLIWEGCWQRVNWPRAALVRLLVVFCFAMLCSWLGIALSRQSEGVATIWLSNGVVFGLLITQPPSRWLGYFLAGLVADTAADVIYGDPLPLAFGVSLANAVEVVNSTLLLTLLFGAPLDLSKRRPLVGFLAVSVVGATALTSVLGAAWTELFVDAGPASVLFRTWWLGDLLGMAVLVPLIVMLQRPAMYSALRGRMLPRTVVVLSASLLTTALVFTHDRDPLIFLLFPVLVLTAFRLGFSGIVLNIVMVAGIAITYTVKGHGPLMLIQGQHMLLHRIIVAQIFVAVTIFTMFPVAALLEEQQSLKVSLAASEARYRELAHSDELTGVSNRRAFNLRLAHEWQQAQAAGRHLGLLVIDADHFKQYNDQFGHLAGDECLRVLAAAISEATERLPSMTARFGGEEFVVLVPGATLDEAARLGERIRGAAQARCIPHPNCHEGVQTVSVGVASLRPGPGQPGTELVTLADAALYRAKSGGRNRVSM